MKLYHVTKVIDGDTFEVDPPIPRNFVLQTPMQRLKGDVLAETPMQRLETPNLFTKVRLAKVNVPEIQKLEGKLATMYLKGLIEQKQVTLKPIGISYDRVVAEVWSYPNKLFVNAAMVYKGYARWA